jgi:hypothetical protein
MNERDRETSAMRLMAALNPVLAAEFDATVSDADLELALDGAIRRGDGSEGLRLYPGRVRSAFRGRRLILGAAAGLALAGAAAAAIALSDDSLTTPLGKSDTPTFPTAQVQAAQESPRLLVTAPGWKVIRADNHDSASGEVEFSDGTDGHDLQITWYPARYYQTYLDDRANVSTPQESTLLGRTATTVTYGNDEYATMLAPQGDTFVEIRGTAGDREAYDQLLQSIQQVDVDTWLAAMPASVVQPSAYPDAVSKMLDGVPLPPHFVLTPPANDTVIDRYQLGAQVMSQVGCGWIETWLDAKKAGDEAKAEYAVDAMTTASHAAILNEMAKDGAYTQVFQQLAQQLRDGEIDNSPSGSETTEDGRTFEVGPGYATALGCDTQYRREVTK